MASVTAVASSGTAAITIATEASLPAAGTVWRLTVGDDTPTAVTVSYTWNGATAGEHTLVSRVTDVTGAVQPTAEDLANKK